MREGATLKLDSGEELRVDVDRDDLEQEEIVVRRATNGGMPLADRLTLIDEVIASATPHPAGTTDRLIEPDRERPY